MRSFVVGLGVALLAITASVVFADRSETVVRASGTLTPGTYGTAAVPIPEGTTGLGVSVDKASIINNVGLVVRAKIWVSYDNGSTWPPVPNGEMGLKCTDNPAAPGTCREGTPSADPYFAVTIHPSCNATCRAKAEVVVEGANYTTSVRVIREFP